jgi:hypothetical protein
MKQTSLIEGKFHSDCRGSLISYNEYSFDPVKRMYVIEKTESNIVRAWQAYKTE